MSKSGPEQLTLPLAHRPHQGRESFLVSDSNRAAWAATTSAEAPRRLVMSGPEGAGKTHLASIWGEKNNALRIDATEMTEQRQAHLMAAPGVVIEGVDQLVDLPGPAARQVETLLFHLCNLATAEDSGLLMTGRKAPGRWQIGLPDLASRLSALPHVSIGSPDDILLSSILHKLLTDRQLVAGEDVILYLIRRMERSFTAAEQVVDELDRLALARRRPITRHLARELFSDADPDEEKGEP
ncbi:MAG: chromosomal replication initiator DnaA [Paracoccaceae bacterium]